MAELRTNNEITKALLDVNLTNSRVVAIDGGTATGKGRLIEELTQLLRLKGVPVIHLSTGSLYRAVAYAALEVCRVRVKGRRDKNEAEVTAEALELLRAMPVEQMLVAAQKRQVEMHGGLVWIDGALADVDAQLKGPGSGTGASIVSRQVPVRQFVDAATRRQVNEFDGFVLVDGRDITHTVLPDAPLKLLMTVAPEVAVARSREHTMEEIVARDHADRNREHGALRHAGDPGEGVIVLATDEHTPESVRDHVYGLMRKAWPELPEL
jgi:cytidylate kinase